MNKTQMVIEHIRANPGCTNAQISAAIGVPANVVAVTTSKYFTKGALERREHHSTITNVRVFQYFPATEKKTTLLTRKITSKQQKGSGFVGFDALVDQMADALVAQITDRVKSKLTEQLSAVMSLPAPEALRAGPVEVLPPAEPEKVRLPKVGVVGLLPVQAGLISHEYGQAFDLSFPESIGQMKIAAINCEHVFVMEFNGHSTWGNVKNGRCEAVFIHGGMLELRNRLAALHKEYQ